MAAFPAAALAAEVGLASKGVLYCGVLQGRARDGIPDFICGGPGYLCGGHVVMFCCSFNTFSSCSLLLKSCLQLQMGHLSCLPQKMGKTGTNQMDIHSLLLTGLTLLL